MAKIPQKTNDWLRSISEGQQTGVTGENLVTPGDVSVLLQKAARCYAIAGWADDACRVFEQLGDFRSAGSYHEQQGRLEQAARCYVRAADWQSAARCFLACNQPAEAAECMMKAGDTLQAAWVWAHRAHYFGRAGSVARKIVPEHDWQRMAIQLVLARCESGQDSSDEAAKRLHVVVSKLGKLPADINRRLLGEWALAVAESLRRPDLIALIHAAAVSSGIPQANEDWEAWAVEVLGDAAGVPERKHDQQTESNNKKFLQGPGKKKEVEKIRS